MWYGDWISSVNVDTMVMHFPLAITAQTVCNKQVIKVVNRNLFRGGGVFAFFPFVLSLPRLEVVPEIQLRDLGSAVSPPPPQRGRTTFAATRHVCWALNTPKMRRSLVPLPCRVLLTPRINPHCSRFVIAFWQCFWPSAVLVCYFFPVYKIRR